MTHDQLVQVFNILKESTQNASAIYDTWIKSVPSQLVDDSIQKYASVNLDDPNQRDNLLFPLLRFNMYVIDFWLSHAVYPYEAKTFETKLMCTSWDLCSEHFEHRVTGFSGTNDTKNILPMPIAQNDLEELDSTNEIVGETLLLPENQSYISLPANVSGKRILEMLTEKQIPVLLDSGALMLELNNEEVAKEWIKMAPTAYDVAIYFDSNNTLQTIDRNGIITEFDYSVYRNNLSKCIVYLDDVHTRGTDLKFPSKWKACVTLCGDVTHDKTVQACMRMRQLGTDHSISFWASYEADVRIRKICNLAIRDQVTNENVVKFICHNSRHFESENMVHWSAAAFNYTKKLSAHKLIDETNKIRQLYHKCVDDEFVKLNEMYGDKEEILLTEIADNKFAQLASEYERNEEICSFIQRMSDRMSEKLHLKAPDVKRYIHTLDEEQEKELEQEMEEERHVERPSKVNPAKPNFNQKLEQLILHGVNGNNLDNLKMQHALLSFSSALLNTKLYRYYRKKNGQAWDDHLFITKDFHNVVDGLSEACDDFLRPVWWIACIKNPKSKDILILLSPYECNRLLPTFRKSEKSILHMFRPRVSQFHSNLLNDTMLQVTKRTETKSKISLEYEVQLEMFSGSMYFTSEGEQNAYCGFLGLIPRKRTQEQEAAFVRGTIQPNGFVPFEKRRNTGALIACVGQCKFIDNPVSLAIKLIEAHHQTLIKESHVASILEKGTKKPIESNSQ